MEKGFRPIVAILMRHLTIPRQRSSVAAAWPHSGNESACMPAISRARVFVIRIAKRDT
jgi:hypothetical protein